jgi:hypothetical protein
MKDPEIRQLLKSTKLKHFLTDGSSRVVEEMKLPAASARIDIAAINGHLHGFEIKSASDTLNRLPSQMEAYTKVFDYVHIVTEGKYYDKILAMTPSWVGVYTCRDVNGTPSLKSIRKAKRNMSQEAFYLAKLLWREEIFAVLQAYAVPHKKAERNWLLCEALAKHLPVQKLALEVRTALKNRPASWLGNLQ